MEKVNCITFLKPHSKDTPFALKYQYGYAISVRPEKLEELGIVHSRNLARKDDDMGHCFCLRVLESPLRRRKKQRLEGEQTSGFMDRESCNHCRQVSVTQTERSWGTRYQGVIWIEGLGHGKHRESFSLSRFGLSVRGSIGGREV